jgi:two-component system sensor histidine kinase UhpB
MWKQLSLQARLFLPLGFMFVAALIVGAVLLRVFATSQLIEENEPIARSTERVADALNAALRVAADPERTLDAFGQALGSGPTVQFRRAVAAAPAPSPTATPGTPGRVPAWFVDVLAPPEVGAAYPILIGDSHVADLLFAPDLSADLYEKWIGFLAIAVSGTILALLTGTIAYFIAGTALRPLQQLALGLTRMSKGNYGELILPAGPPEIRQSCEAANELARTLNQLSQDNRSLLRKMVSLQDDERRDLARELHDELGPLLFGIRANTVALLEAASDEMQLHATTQGVVQSVEALQQANRRILDRLRPLYIHELGLTKSIETLLRNTRDQAPRLQVTAEIDPRLGAVDGVLSHTIYRVVQEAVTNVLRHANAASMKIKAKLGRDEVLIEVFDDGVGFSQDNAFGRGLTGMQERVRALGGTLLLLREDGLTCIRCGLPTGRQA